MAAKAEKPQATQDWPDSYWKCRDLGHAWQWDGVSRREDGDTDWRNLTCRDCPTTKVQAIVNGYVWKGRYNYPKGYVLRGADVLSRQEVRGIIMRSVRASRRRLKVV